MSGKCTNECATDKAAPKNNLRGRTICTDSEEKYIPTASHEVKLVGLSGPKLSSTFHAALVNASDKMPRACTSFSSCGKSRTTAARKRIGKAPERSRAVNTRSENDDRTEVLHQIQQNSHHLPTAENFSGLRT